MWFLGRYISDIWGINNETEIEIIEVNNDLGQKGNVRKIEGI